MDNQYRLVDLGNSELVAGLTELARQSHLLTSQLLAHLVELEQRMLHLELGFSSLFSYCVEALGMSEGTAGRRVAAARVCRRFPEVFPRIARGELHLCALCALAPHLDPENADELFEASRSKTRRQIEELLAARFPRPDVREQIRRLPARARPPAAAPPTTSLQDQGDEQVLPRTIAEIRPILRNRPPSPAAQPVPNSSQRRVELEPLSLDRFGVHFTADAELRELIERARALASHRLPKGDLASLIKLMATRFVEHEEKRRFGIGARQRRAHEKSQTTRATNEPTPPGGAPARPSPTGSKQPREPREPRERPASNHQQSRYLPVAVRRAIHERDGGRCAFFAADGRRCNARAFVEFDHVQPFAKDGPGDERNLRLLCKAHNLLHARRCFGVLHIAGKIAARRQSGQYRHER